MEGQKEWGKGRKREGWMGRRQEKVGGSKSDGFTHTVQRRKNRRKDCKEKGKKEEGGVCF